jgi:hypothetical protein
VGIVREVAKSYFNIGVEFELLTTQDKEKGLYSSWRIRVVNEQFSSELGSSEMPPPKQPSPPGVVHAAMASLPSVCPLGYCAPPATFASGAAASAPASAAPAVGTPADAAMPSFPVCPLAHGCPAGAAAPTKQQEAFSKSNFQLRRNSSSNISTSSRTSTGSLNSCVKLVRVSSNLTDNLRQKRLKLSDTLNLHVDVSASGSAASASASSRNLACNSPGNARLRQQTSPGGKPYHHGYECFSSAVVPSPIAKPSAPGLTPHANEKHFNMMQWVQKLGKRTSGSRQESDRVPAPATSSAAGIGLTKDMLSDVFPYHIVFDRELKVLQCGNFLEPFVKYDLVGQCVLDYFEVQDPYTLTKDTWDWDVFVKSTEYCDLELECRLPPVGAGTLPLCLKGPVIFTKQCSLAIVLCAPNVRTLSSMKKQGLVLQNLQNRDLYLKLFMLSEHLSSETEVSYRPANWSWSGGVEWMR